VAEELAEAKIQIIKKFKMTNEISEVDNSKLL
jgi:hypothetical protein